MIRSELAKLHRGLIAMREAFGWQFTAAILAVAALLLVSVGARAGIPALVLGALLVLLAIRAHDLGDDDEERTEFTEHWDPSPAGQRAREDAFLAEQLEDLQAREAQARFLSARDAAALGKPHKPSEL